MPSARTFLYTEKLARALADRRPCAAKSIDQDQSDLTQHVPLSLGSAVAMSASRRGDGAWLFCELCTSTTHGVIASHRHRALA